MSINKPKKLNIDNHFHMTTNGDRTGPSIDNGSGGHHHNVPGRRPVGVAHRHDGFLDPHDGLPFHTHDEEGGGQTDGPKKHA